MGVIRQNNTENPLIIEWTSILIVFGVVFYSILGIFKRFRANMTFKSVDDSSNIAVIPKLGTYKSFSEESLIIERSTVDNDRSISQYNDTTLNERMNDMIIDTESQLKLQTNSQMGSNKILNMTLSSNQSTSQDDKPRILKDSSDSRVKKKSKKSSKDKNDKEKKKKDKNEVSRFGFKILKKKEKNHDIKTSSSGDSEKKKREKDRKKEEIVDEDKIKDKKDRKKEKRVDEDKIKVKKDRKKEKRVDEDKIKVKKDRKKEKKVDEGKIKSKKEKNDERETKQFKGLFKNEKKNTSSITNVPLEIPNKNTTALNSNSVYSEPNEYEEIPNITFSSNWDMVKIHRQNLQNENKVQPPATNLREMAMQKKVNNENKINSSRKVLNINMDEYSNNEESDTNA